MSGNTKTSSGSPIRNFGLIMSSILVCEAAIEVVLHAFPIPRFWMGFLDPILLALITAPAIHYLVVRPMSRMILQRSNDDAALREKAAQFVAIFENAPTPMFLLDADRFVRSANTAAGRLAGDSPEAMIGKRSGEAVHCAGALNDCGGYGFGPSCQSCVLRRTILETFQSRQPHVQVEATVTIASGDARQCADLMLTMTPLTVGGESLALLCIEDITERKQAEKTLRTAACTDKLTGLPNRALLLDRLQRVILRRQRCKDVNYAVLFLDFDRFKTVNDSLGHDVGDQLLQQIADRLRGAVRAVDSVGRPSGETTAARLGGDEFVVLLDGLHSAKDAAIVADRLLEVLRVPYKIGINNFVSTASIGIVTSEYGHERAEDVLRDADTAMYEAKLRGRSRAVFFDSAMRDRVRRKLQIENGLRKALELGQFLLHYQPIVSLESGLIDGFECLVRWQHPEHGIISPGEFIPVAEETGLIVPLGEWVFREACRRLGVWWKEHGRQTVPSLSVNLSRHQLAIPGLPAHFRNLAKEAGVDPAAIHLEVTESAIMSDTKLAESLLQEIKASGFKVDMDDFGTGYSSLACLHQFSFDVLKIDRSFIAGLDLGEDMAALVNTIVTLTRNMGIRLVAEGVETESQMTMLQALGCEFAQGYLFARPMPGSQVIDFISEFRRKVRPDPAFAVAG